MNKLNIEDEQNIHNFHIMNLFLLIIEDNKIKIQEKITSDVFGINDLYIKLNLRRENSIC